MRTLNRSTALVLVGLALILTACSGGGKSGHSGVGAPAPAPSPSPSPSPSPTTGLVAQPGPGVADTTRRFSVFVTAEPGTSPNTVTFRVTYIGNFSGARIVKYEIDYTGAHVGPLLIPGDPTSQGPGPAKETGSLDPLTGFEFITNRGFVAGRQITFTLFDTNGTTVLVTSSALEVKTDKSGGRGSFD